MTTVTLDGGGDEGSHFNEPEATQSKPSYRFQGSITAYRYVEDVETRDALFPHTFVIAMNLCSTARRKGLASKPKSLEPKLALIFLTDKTN